MKRADLKTYLLVPGLLITLPCTDLLAGPPGYPPPSTSFPNEAAPFDHDALLWLAQSCGNDGPCPEVPKPPEYRESNNDIGSPGKNLNSGVTNALIRIIERADSTCDERIELRYRIDCLRIYYGWVADALPDNGDYLPIKKAMRRAEQKLEAIVNANLDTGEPAIRPREGHKKNAKRMPPIRAVKKSAAPKAAAQAAAVVEETELLILRSGEDPSRRTPHYTEIAAALDDNLLILRSA